MNEMLQHITVWGLSMRGKKSLMTRLNVSKLLKALKVVLQAFTNVGLIYLETENYQKAALAFEQALEIEDNMPTRYIAYARSLEKLGKEKLAISALEKAADLDERPQILRALWIRFISRLKISKRRKRLRKKWTR